MIWYADFAKKSTAEQQRKSSLHDESGVKRGFDAYLS